MKPYMTAQEIVDSGLSGLPKKVNGLTRMAKRENWPSQPREGRGGGREYAVHALPQVALSELAFRAVEIAAEKQKQDDAPLDPYGAPKSSARACILRISNQFIEITGLSQGVASKLFVERYNEKTLNVLPWILRYFPKLSARSLRRWKLTSDKHGTDALVDKQRGPKGSSLWDTNAELREYVIAQIAGKPHVVCESLHKGVLANIENPPSLRSLQMYVKKYRNENSSALLYAANPDQWKSHRRAAFGSMSADILRLNQKWEIDGTIADVQCQTDNGTLTRYSLVALIDVFSRRSKVLVTLQPSAIATAACLRTAIIDWGLPERLKADNGKDYTAAHVERIASDLGFALDYCTPFSPEQKPHVERFFGTLTRELFEVLPGFVGHSVADQQALRARKSMGQRFGASKTATFTLTAAELQIVINDWLENTYELRVHSGIKTTPYQKALDGRARRIKDERALDLLLAPAPGQDGVRMVQKKGVSVFNHWYISAELGGLVGSRVSVRIDPENEARVVIYSADTREFICTAEDPTMTGADMRDIALRARQTQTRELKKLRDQQKAATAVHNPDKLASDILGHAAEKASKVAAIRAPYVDITPASIEREREAAAALDNPNPEPAPLTDEQVAKAKVNLVEITYKPTPSFTVWPSDPLERPQFAMSEQGDFDFWKWATNLQKLGLLDDETTLELAELESELHFALVLESKGLKPKNTYKKLGVIL